jgi:PadR family transcriptional regulator, regulatory protein PadR
MFFCILLSVIEGNDVTRSTELLQGTVDLLILKVLSLEPMHGWAIAQRIKQLSKEVLRLNQSALYPASHRLEHQAWIKAEWGESENNRRAKYYSLTKAGRARLAAEEQSWDRLSTAVRVVLKAV